MLAPDPISRSCGLDNDGTQSNARFSLQAAVELTSAFIIAATSHLRMQKIYHELTDAGLNFTKEFFWKNFSEKSLRFRIEKYKTSEKKAFRL